MAAFPACLSCSRYRGEAVGPVPKGRPRVFRKEKEMPRTNNVTRITPRKKEKKKERRKKKRCSLLPGFSMKTSDP